MTDQPQEEGQGLGTEPLFAVEWAPLRWWSVRPRWHRWRDARRIRHWKGLR